MNRAAHRKFDLLFLTLVVMFLVMVAHWPALSARTLSFDDHQYLFQNDLVQNPSWASAERFLTEVMHPSTVKGYYQPLAMISIMFDVARGGSKENLRPFHETSLALHMANTGLVIVILFLLFRRAWPAAMAGLLFGVHPLTVEAIPWVGERKTLLAAFFAFSSILLYVLYARGKGSRVQGSEGLRVREKTSWSFLYPPPLGPLNPRTLYFVGAVIAFVLSLMSKPTGTPLPVVLLLMDVWPLGRLQLGRSRLPGGTSRRATVTARRAGETPAPQRSGPARQAGPTETTAVSARQIFLEKLPFFLIAGASAYVTFISQRDTAVADPAPAAAVFCILCHNIVFYLYKIAWPVHLSSHYVMPKPFDLSTPAYLYGFIGTILLLPALAISWKWTRAVLFGWLIFFMAIFPTLGIIGFTKVIACDKYAYLPSIGLLMTLTWLLTWMWDRCRMSNVGCRMSEIDIPHSTFHTPHPTSGIRHFAVVGTVLALGGLLTWRTQAYEHEWQDSETFFRYMLTLTPDAPALHGQLGLILRGEGKNDEAVEHYFRAIELDSTDGTAHHNLANALMDMGRLDEAYTHYSEAWRADAKFRQAIQRLMESMPGCVAESRVRPDDASPQLRMGIVYNAVGQLNEAEWHVRKALSLDARNPYVWYNLGNLFFDQRQEDEALSAYAEALRLRPDWWLARRKIEGAASFFQEVAAAQPSDPAVRVNLGIALTALGQVDAGRGQFEAALRLRPGDARIQYEWGNALVAAGRAAEAAAAYQEAIRLRPDRAEAYHKLSIVLEKLGRGEEAAAAASKAAELAAVRMPGPPCPIQPYDVATALATMEAWDQAAAAFEEALRAEPNHVPALVNLGNVLGKLRRHDEAIAHYRRAAALEPGNLHALFNLATELKEQGKYAEAVAAYDAVLRIEPESEEARAARSAAAAAAAKLGNVRP